MAAHPRRFRGVRGSPKFPQASSDRTDGDPGGSRDGCNAAIANRACFGGGQQAALTFVQMRGQHYETIADWSEIDHSPTIRDAPIPSNRPVPRALNRLAYFRASPNLTKSHSSLAAMPI
jgi:hypothetical protein